MESIYKRLYYHLFNQISDAIGALNENNCKDAMNILIFAQQESEEFYMEYTRKNRRS